MCSNSFRASHRARRVRSCALILALAVAGAGASAQDAASGPQARAAAAVVRVQARVVGIDVASNSVTLQGPNGRMAEVAVNPQVGDVGKLRLGDTLNMDYRSALLVQATKVRSNGIRERVDTQAAIPASGGITAQARVVEVIGTIERVDAKKRTVVLRGPQRTVTLTAAPDVSLAGLSAGDMVRARFESAVAVQVLRDGQPLR
jgi:Cu/Ag efflux protein CusF